MTQGQCQIGQLKGLLCPSIEKIHLLTIQEGHDGPEIAHLYIGPRGGDNIIPGAFN
jgi:hypothetical protein